MPKLSKLEFAKLVQSMPGASEDEIFAAAKAQEESFPELQGVSFDKPQPKAPISPTIQAAQNIAGPTGAAVAGLMPEWLRKVTDVAAAPALRTVPAVGGAMLGGALGGPVGAGAGGAAGAGLGETGAEGLEVQTGERERLNPSQIAFQTALGAVPTFGKVGGVASGLLNRGAQGALLGGAGAAGTEFFETGQAPSLKGTLLGAGAGALFGGTMGAAEGRAAGRLNAPPVPVDAPPVPAGPLTDHRNSGLAFKNFFSDVTKGAEQYKPQAAWTPLLEHKDPSFLNEYANHTGNFDNHIATSIPGYRDVQARKGIAIVKTFGDGANMLDIGASEGGFNKSISALSGGRIRTTALDPNPDMANFFHTKSQVPGANYAEEAFHQGFEDGGKIIPAHNPQEPYDVIHEAMAFQFISPERAAQVAEAKRLLKPGGVFITEQKVLSRDPQVWAANEALKDTKFKKNYFTDDALKAKQAVVKFNQDPNEAKAVGMVDNMVHDDDLEGILKQNFRYVVQYYDAGNFKGYASADSPEKLQQFIQNLGDTKTEFSTAQTPRIIANGQQAVHENYDLTGAQRGMQAARTQQGLQAGQQFAPEAMPQAQPKAPKAVPQASSVAPQGRVGFEDYDLGQAKRGMLDARNDQVTRSVAREVALPTPMAGNPGAEFHAVENGFNDAAVFTHPAQSPLVNGSDFAILTASNPNGQVLTPAENAARNAELMKVLKAKGYTPLAQRGHYGGNPEPSFIVPGMTPEDAAAVGQQFGQDAVISKAGWQRLGDGKTFPQSAPPTFDQSAAQNYSEIDIPGQGSVKYQLDYPAEAYETPARTAAPAAHAPLPQESAVAKTGTEGPLAQPKGNTNSDFLKEKARVDAFRRDAAKKGGFTAGAIAAPAAAQLIPDDPNSELDDYARAALDVGGVGALAHIGLSPKMAKNLTAILKTGETEAKGLTLVRKFLKEKFPKNANTLFQQFAAKDVVPQGPLPNVDLSQRKPLLNGVVKAKKVAYKDPTTGKTTTRTEVTLSPEATARLDGLFEHAKTLGADWTKDGAELEKLIPDAGERRMFTRSFAALSPTTPLELNFLQSAVAYPMLRAGASPQEVIEAVSKHPGLGVGNPKSKGPNLARAAAGEELSGDKVSALDKGVYGAGADEVPLDIHFLRAMGAVEEKRPPKLLYEAINRAIAKHAMEKHGIGAFDYMAPIWGAMRQITTGDAGGGVAQLAKRVGLDQPSVFTGNTLARFSPEDFPGAPRGLNNPAAKPALDPQVMRERMYPAKEAKKAPDELAAARKAGQQKLFDKSSAGDIYKTPADIERELQRILANAPSMKTLIRYGTPIKGK